MLVKISPVDLKLLLSNIFTPAIFSKLIAVENSGEHFVKKYPTGYFLLDVTNTEAEAVVECLSDLLITKGISPDGEINDLGYRLEVLIDSFHLE